MTELAERGSASRSSFGSAKEPIRSKTVLTAGLLRVENPRSGLVSAADVVNLFRA